MALLRPTELARLWELHPKTVYAWIREGKLPAIKTPGAQYRIRTDDARAYCDKHGIPLPRALRGLEVHALGKPGPAQRAVEKTCKNHGATFVAWPRALEGLLAIARDAPDVVLVDARCEEVKVGDAVRALRKTESTKSLALVVHDAATKNAALGKLAVTVVLRGDHEQAALAVATALEATRTARRVRG